MVYLAAGMWELGKFVLWRLVLCNLSILFDEMSKRNIISCLNCS